MARRPRINWRQVDEEKITNLLRDFNSKVGRLAKKQPDLNNVLPKRLTREQFKKGVSTRADFNRRYNEYKRFLRKGAELPITNDQGLTISKWEKKENEIKARAVTNARQKELARIEGTPLTDRGNPTGIIRGERKYTQAERELRPKNFNFERIRPGKEYQQFKTALEKQVMSDYFQNRYEIYKKNYINKLDSEFGGRASNVINILKDVDAEVIFNAMNSDPDLHIDFIYDDSQADEILPYLTEAWPNYLEAVELGIKF